MHTVGKVSLGWHQKLKVLLGHFGIGSRKEKKVRGSEDKERKSRINQLQQYYLHVLIFMCDFLTIFDMHGIACGSFVVMACVFPSAKLLFSLAFPFPHNLDEMGSHTSVELDCRMDSKLGGVDLQNGKHMA